MCWETLRDIESCWEMLRDVERRFISLLSFPFQILKLFPKILPNYLWLSSCSACYKSFPFVLVKVVARNNSALLPSITIILNDLTSLMMYLWCGVVSVCRHSPRTSDHWLRYPGTSTNKSSLCISYLCDFKTKHFLYVWHKWFIRYNNMYTGCPPKNFTYRYL